MRKTNYSSFWKGTTTCLNHREKEILSYRPKDFLYGRKGPWPQPSPDHPFGESPAVLKIPLREILDWWIFVGLRYVVTLLLTPFIYIYYLFNRGLVSVSDKEFNSYLTKSMMSKFLSHQLDKSDLNHFKDYINEDETYLITDLSPVEVVDTFEGIFVSPSKTLLELRDGKYVVKCIYIDDSKEIFTPKDGEGWELAKYFVLQGAALCATLVEHPSLHFPLDSINAITKTALPKEHILFKLLYPHLRFTLQLENAVLTYKTSLLQSKWWMPYAPYPGPYDGLRELLVCGYKGMIGNKSYTGYQFYRRPRKIYSEYGDFLNLYYDTIHDFVSEVLADVKCGDRAIENWANYISPLVPNFPDGKEIFEEGNLVDTVSYFIWDVTIAHSLDHYNYGAMNIQKVPLRIRHTAPTKGMSYFSRKKLVSAVDQTKYRMSQLLFFKPTNVTCLYNTNYNFKEEKLIRMNKDFLQNLHEAERSALVKGINYMPLKDIARSIQY
ncbi:hypothetical protein [Halobacteriovorax sp. JY17]|uniref:hypothetical protein n=1 Tax=Halobacteriovorax sp. JY17 TaxID=2014617 RepID=UPI000C62B475|nr:hypothetical protein [Halobacteriovorax sp. JY17]PIK16183.1 MAG: hypothetical protein CES88_05465 [Halobacteriovorax sp. JY17]